MKVGIHTRLKPGAEESYESYHRAVWPEVLAAIHCIKCDDYDAAIAELATDPANMRWQSEMAPMMAAAHDYSGQSGDRLPLVFDLND